MERIKNSDLDEMAEQVNYHGGGAMIYWEKNGYGYHYDLYAPGAHLPDRSKTMTKRELYNCLKTMAHTLYMVRIGEITPRERMD